MGERPTLRADLVRACTRLRHPVKMSKAAFAGLKAVQEIRFHLCQTGKGSEGVRNFLLKSYKNMKAASPATPILIREASGVEGGLVARFGTCPATSCARIFSLPGSPVVRIQADARLAMSPVPLASHE